jgi:hypothetical protein
MQAGAYGQHLTQLGAKRAGPQPCTSTNAAESCGCSKTLNYFKSKAFISYFITMKGQVNPSRQKKASGRTTTAEAVRHHQQHNSSDERQQSQEPSSPKVESDRSMDIIATHQSTEGAPLQTTAKLIRDIVSEGPEYSSLVEKAVKFLCGCESKSVVNVKDRNDRCRYFIHDAIKQTLTGVLEYSRCSLKSCLSSSGNTLAVNFGTKIDVWRLSAESAELIDVIDVDEDSISSMSCDDRYIAYTTTNESYRNRPANELIIYDIETRTKREVKAPCSIVQVFKGKLYFGDSSALFIADLKELEIGQQNQANVTSLTANAVFVVARYTSGLIEAWEEDFEVAWTTRSFESYANCSLVASDTLAFSSKKKVKIYDIPSSTVLTSYFGFNDVAFVPSRGALRSLTRAWYWLVLSLSSVYYLDVITDIALLGSYFSSENYVLFAISIALIITPNLIEVFKTPHKTLIDSLAKLLFLYHLLAIVRDLRFPTYCSLKRCTGEELNRRGSVVAQVQSTPQLVICIYYILTAEDYSALPFVALASSIVNASIHCNFDMKCRESAPNIALCMTFWFLERLVRVLILALCCVFIFPYFAILFLAFSTAVILLTYCIYSSRTERPLNCLYCLFISVDNSFAAVSWPESKDKYKGGVHFRVIWYHFGPNFLVNLVLILVLQLECLVDDVFVGLLWGLIGTYLTVFLLGTCIGLNSLKYAIKVGF